MQSVMCDVIKIGLKGRMRGELGKKTLKRDGFKHMFLTSHITLSKSPGMYRDGFESPPISWCKQNCCYVSYAILIVSVGECLGPKQALQFTMVS